MIRWYSQTPLFRGYDFGRKIKNSGLKNGETGGTAKQGGSPCIHQWPKYNGLTGNIGDDNTLLHYKTLQYAFIYSLKLFYQSKYILKTIKVHSNDLNKPIKNQCGWEGPGGKIWLPKTKKQGDRKTGGRETGGPTVYLIGHYLVGL